MKRNALMPFALIAVVGIVLIIALSIVGQDKYKELVKENGGEEQTTAAKEDSAAKEDKADKKDAAKEEATDENKDAAKDDAAATEDAAEGETVAVDADAAKATLKTSCVACHGQNLEGGVGPSLNDVGSRLSADEIEEVLKNGRGAMPKGLIKGDDLENVVAYLAEQKGK